MLYRRLGLKILFLEWVIITLGLCDGQEDIWTESWREEGGAS